VLKCADDSFYIGQTDNFARRLKQHENGERCFLKDGAVTVLGALVCGNHPGDRLGFRAHVHGYVDAPSQIAQDKQDFVDNVLPLMESSLGYLMRNIQVGITAEEGGRAVPQYPEELLRETVNNALAHRDYTATPFTGRSATYSTNWRRAAT
jgi:predicted HTH transcriptional regulator